MRRVPPSMLIREDLDRLFADGAGPGENLISELVSTVTRLVVQQLAEAEQTDYLGDRGRYVRRDRGAGQRGWRNGYVEASMRTGEGKIPIRVPQVRDTDVPFRSTLMGFLEGDSDVLERLVTGDVCQGHVNEGC